MKTKLNLSKILMLSSVLILSYYLIACGGGKSSEGSYDSTSVTAQLTGSCRVPEDDELRKIFIPKDTSNRLRAFYVKEKRPILDSVVRSISKNPTDTERESFLYRDGKEFVRILNDELLQGGLGLRIYFGSYKKQDTSSDSGLPYLESGKLTAILAPTRQTEVRTENGKRIAHKDIGKYWILDDKTGKVVEIDAKFKRNLIGEYANNKKRSLKRTLHREEQRDSTRQETFSVHFRPNFIRIILNEFCYQLQRLGGSRKLGVLLDVISYDKGVRSVTSSEGETHLLRQRLSLHFSLFDNKLGKRLDMVKEDPTRYGPIQKEYEDQSFFGSSFNTGDPTPPFPDDGIQ